MTSANKDDADHLARYAENLMEHANAAVALANQRKEQWLTTYREAIRLRVRARIAKMEAKAQIK